MKRTIAAAALLLAGCALQGGGALGPTATSWFPVLANDASVLMSAALTCPKDGGTGNAQAAGNYRLAMAICKDPLAMLAQVPTIPFDITTPSQKAGIVSLQCIHDGYVPPMPMTIQVVTNCPAATPVATPMPLPTLAPVPTPTPAQIAK